MNANELADELDKFSQIGGDIFFAICANKIRELQEKNDKFQRVLESIANEYVELSHDKIKWQNADHIRWAKEALK
jgi:hypothetical protein